MVAVLTTEQQTHTKLSSSDRCENQRVASFSHFVTTDVSRHELRRHASHPHHLFQEGRHKVVEQAHTYTNAPKRAAPSPFHLPATSPQGDMKKVVEKQPLPQTYTCAPTEQHSFLLYFLTQRHRKRIIEAILHTLKRTDVYQRSMLPLHVLSL